MGEVFISHAEPDSDWAERLAARLEHHGVGVSTCRLLPGDVMVHRLESAIREASCGVQVFSPHTMNAPWVAQLYAALCHASVEGNLRFIPVLYGDVELPPFAAMRVFLDFRNADSSAFEAKVLELVRVVRGHRPPPRDAAPDEVLALVQPAQQPIPPPVPPAFAVCYAPADVRYGERLVGLLAGAALPAHSLDQVQQAREFLRYASAVLVVVSPAAQTSEALTWMIREGLRQSRRFFPVLLSGERHALLARTVHFDARDGALPGPAELVRFRRWYAAHRAGVPDEAEPPPALPTRSTHVPARASLDGLRELLDGQEIEHADLLTTTIVLDAAGRLDVGFLLEADAKRLPSSLLNGIDDAWTEFSAGTYGFRAQRNLSRIRRGTYAEFLPLSMRCGWRSAEEEVVPRYRDFFRRGGGTGFFPTLRSPQNEQYLDWYYQWVETVLGVHLRLGRP